MEKFTSVIIAAMFAVPAMAQRTVDGTDRNYSAVVRMA